MKRRAFPRSSLVAVLGGFALAVACSDDPPAGTVAATDAGAAAPDGEAGAPSDAASDAQGVGETTSLTALLGGVGRALDRAQFGVETDDGGAERFHLEAHAGGAPECPSQASPTPERTLVVSGIRGAPGAVLTKADGVTAAYFDFAGDQLMGAPLTRATAVEVTVLAVGAGAPPGSVAVEIDATFAEGTVKGKAFASFCASLSD